MKFAKLLHNPGAGEGEYSKKELISMVQSAGYGCSYSSTKKDGWEKIESAEIDFIILAGGDGTVRKVADSLLKKRLLERRYPIALLPMGTANNIAKTLNIPRNNPDGVIAGWHNSQTRKFDVGRIYGINKSPFFLESFGVGVFPELMMKMEKYEKKIGNDPDEAIRTALEVLRELVEKAQAKFCRLVIDGVEHRGNFIMVEVMNTRSIGPKLHIAPLADPSDGFFDVVMVTERERGQCMAYLDTLLQGKEEASFFNVIRAKKLEMFYDANRAHVDDEIVEIKKETTVKLELLHGLLEFLIPANGHATPA